MAAWVGAAGAAALAYDKPLCASLDSFTLHAATCAAALDPARREALLRCVLRPPLAQERLELRPDGLVRIKLKKAYADGTLAVDMAPSRSSAAWRQACPAAAGVACATLNGRPKYLGQLRAAFPNLAFGSVSRACAAAADGPAPVVLTFPFSWRRRRSQDGALLGRLGRIFVEAVEGFYTGRAAEEGVTGAKTGSVAVVQRSSSDLRLNPPPTR